jgi:ubiquinone/menaquinone biosynthesis C-methylase UbiE
VTLARVRDAYAARAAEYTEVLGAIERAAEQDRVDVLAWARSVDGPILDVGCGPGQWTDFLREEGCDIEGIDPVHAFIEAARQRYPLSRYRVGSAEHLEVLDESLGGVLAWFSLIHVEPDSIGSALAEIERCLRPGGSLLVGFVDGDARRPFDHAVVTAYYWSVPALRDALETAGLAVTSAKVRADPGVRPQGSITARKAARRAAGDRWSG